MKKTLLFVILQQYADWEAAYISSAISMLGQGEYEIKTVSLSKDCVQSISIIFNAWTYSWLIWLVYAIFRFITK